MRAKRQMFRGWLTQLTIAALVAMPLQFLFPITTPATATVDPTWNSIYTSPSTGFVRVAASQDFNFGNGDFTMEGWVYVDDFTGWSATHGNLLEVNNDDGAYLLVGLQTDGSWRQVSHNANISGAQLRSTAGVTTLNTWNHFALVKNGTNLTTYVNGIARLTASVPVGDVLGFGDHPFGIGADPGNGNKGKYALSNIRVVKGTAVYNFGNTVGTSYFTPPTSALKAIPGTKLLLATSGATLDALLTDTSGTSKTVTKVSSPTIRNLYPPLKADQLPLTVSSSNGTYGEALTLTTSGGSGTGAVSYTVISGNCTVSGDVLSSTSAGDCVVSATKASDDSYSAATSDNKTISIANPAPTAFVVTFNKQNNTTAATETVTQGFAATTPTAPTWYGYNFKGWSETSTGSLVDVSTVTITGTTTFYAIWEQKSLAGLTNLSNPDILNPHATFDRTITSSYGNTTTSIKVPGGALPSTFQVKVYTIEGDSFASQALGAGTYLISQVVAWADTATGSVGNIQDTAAGKPIEMTITSPSITVGSKVYALLGNSSQVLGTATENGRVTVTFSEDPVIIVEAGPPAVVTPTTTGSSPGSVVASVTPEATKLAYTGTDGSKLFVPTGGAFGLLIVGFGLVLVSRRRAKTKF
jgi:uncharacterized repeat protein (TIGR02543 family)